MLENIITSIMGLTGAIIGSGITILYQSITDRKKEFKEKKNECLKGRKDIVTKLDKTERIIQKIIAFIKSDFSCLHETEENEEENCHIYNSITHIYDDHNQYFWDDFIIDIYNIMPKTASIECFQILNRLMMETREMAVNIFEFIDAQDENLIELQERFIESRHKYTAAMYTVHLLKEEFQGNIIKRGKISIARNYYKKNKAAIKKAIKEFNGNILQG
jgi:hypothetical protein